MRYSLSRFLISFFLIALTCHAEEASKTPVFSKELLQKAESGDAGAQLEIAACYGEGLGVDKNQKTAFEWVKKSADQGFPKANLVLARCYLFGWGVAWDEVKAKKIFQEAEAGNPRAQDDLGNFFSGKYGRTEKKDIPQALSWWEKAAAQGYAPSQNKLGRAYLVGLGVEKNSPKAFEFFQKSAEQKNSGAECELGYCYRDGKGVDKDINKAKEWFEKSANQGNPDGLASLGEFYEKGWADTPIDLAKATDLYQKAADKNHAWSQNRLGHFYWKGIGMSKNETKAFEYFKMSAENGNMYAQNTLGLFYYKAMDIVTGKQIGRAHV